MQVEAGEIQQVAFGRTFGDMLEEAACRYQDHDYRQAHLLAMAAAYVSDVDSSEFEWAIGAASVSSECWAVMSRSSQVDQPVIPDPVVVDYGIPVFRQRADGTWDGPIWGEAPPGAFWRRPRLQRTT